MRKILFFALIVLTFLDVACVFAAGEENSSMTIDNVTFDKDYEIKGYAKVRLLGFKFVNMYAQWEDGKAGKTGKRDWWCYQNDSVVFPQKPVGKEGFWALKNCQFKESGNEAEFAWLKVDITNLQKTSVNFMKEITIKVIYDDEYEYDGWVRQFNPDYNNSEIYRYNETTVIGWPVCLSPVDEMSIGQMFEGHYAFGCTLPNPVVKDKNTPLRMEITIGENKLTYNIR